MCLNKAKLYRSPGTALYNTDSDMQVGHIRLEVYCRNYASLTPPRPNTVHPATYHNTSGRAVGGIHSFN